MTKLSDYCDLVSIQIDPRTKPNAIYIGLEHIRSGELLRSGGGLGTEVLSSKFAFNKNDVLYSKLRPYLDKAVLADCDGICTTELLVLRPKPHIDPRFLACAVHSHDFIEHAMSGVTGSQHPRTSWHRISEFEVAPLSEYEQSGVADLIWKIHESLEANNKTLATTQELKQAAMSELFTRGLRGEALKETEIGLMPSSWEVRRFESVREWLQYGTSVQCDLKRSTYPVLRIPNVEAAFVNITELKYCDLPEAVADKYKLLNGDLLFIRTNGVRERLGKCAVYSGEPTNALFASYLIRARLLPRELVSRYVAYFFSSERGTELVAGGATPAADGKFNLNTGAIDAILLPVPPTLEEQEEIVAILAAVDQKIDLQKRKKTILEELFRMLLHKLMTGKIQVSDLDLSALDAADSVEAIA